MARVHCVRARKDYPAHDIKKGEIYYWWKFRFGGKRFSKIRPRSSQLTQSEYLSAAYSLQERVENLVIDSDDLEGLADELRSVADELRTLGSEQEDKIGNMPESLQDGEIAERLRGRAEACENVASELEAAADDILEVKEDPDLETDDDAVVAAAWTILENIGWDVDPC